MTRPTASHETRITRRMVRAALAASLVLGALLTLAGCSSPQTTGSAESTSTPSLVSFPVTVTDDASRTVEIKAAPQRIVSLAPANTEMLYAVGLGDRVVGVTTYDDYPAEVKDKPKVGDFVSPNLEAIAAAEPDLILATTGVQGDVLAKLEALGAPVLAIDPQSLDGLYADVARIGKATGNLKEAADVVAGMQAQVAEVRSAVASEPVATTFVEIGQDPLYTVGTGTLLDELVALAGGKNVVEQPGYVAYSLEQLVKADPKVYLATKGTMSDPSQLEKRAGYDKLSAVKTGRVAVLDDNLVTRPGPRIVLGLRSIAEALHPEAFGQ